MSGRDRFRRGRLLDRKEIYSGKIVELVVDTIELGGQPHIREVVRHPGGVVVLGQLEDGRIPFVRQLRYPMDRPILELPAGKIDDGEDPATSAAREFEEETGFRARRLQLIFSYYSSPGFCDELLHLYYSDSLEKGRAIREVDEELVVEWYGLEEAIDLALQGEMQDAKTLVAVFWLAHQEEGRSGKA